ncbi:DUF2784 domain-containing protein [bacterium]|nr:DUF2784 domain-containing protein [bacterium]MBU1984180.1 DUF2784 domain-containing protein [bacterium]
MQPVYSSLATAVVVTHALWILWVLGGLFLPRMNRGWRRVHLLSAAATVVVMATRGYCPLTDLEVHFLRQAGQTGYQGSFIQHYAAAFVYGDLIRITPEGLMVLTMLVASLAIVLHWGKSLSRL